MTKFFNACVQAGLAAAILAACSPALAQTSDEPMSITVPYADVDITHPEGARVLLERIKAAASRVCGGAPDAHELMAGSGYDRCRRSAVDEAVTKVGSPILTAVASGHATPVQFAGR